MAEIINNTNQEITLLETKPKKKDLKEWKIPPRDYLIIPDKLWNQFRKNKQVKKLIEDKKLIAPKELNLLTRLFSRGK